MATRSVAVLLAILASVGCNRGRGQAPALQTKLESAIASGATSIDFAEDPAFAWDRMYVFGCYSSRESVEQTLGFSWPEFSHTTISSSDSVVLVVFVQNGKVVGWYEQPRKIELGGLANEEGYARSESVFDVQRSAGRIELLRSRKSRNSHASEANGTPQNETVRPERDGGVRP